MADLRRVVEERLRDLERRTGRRDAVLEDLEKARARLETVFHEKAVCREASVLVETAAESGRRSLRAAFEDIVGAALRAILGPDYRLEIVQAVKRSSATALFAIASGEYEEAVDPLESRGGGVVDVLAFALRTVLLELVRPRVEGPIILDEPFRNLSADRVEAAATFLREVGQRFGRQILIVTHVPRLAEVADRVVELA